MVNYCIQKAVENKISSFVKLWHIVKDEIRRWDYARQYHVTACRVACSILKAWRKKVKKKEADPKSPPQVKRLFVKLHSTLTKFEGNRLRISVRAREYVWVDLKFGKYQQRFINEWKQGKLKIGEILITPEKVIVPFKKKIELIEAKQWLAIDINECNVTGVSTDGSWFIIDTSEVKRIRHVYFKKRKRIQSGIRTGKRRKRLLAKYGRREKNRVKDILHKVSKTIVEFAKVRGCGIILEDLNGIRKRIDYGRVLNRRLHNWSFRKLQHYIEYKAKLEGLPVIYVDPKGTSSYCPICGEKLAPNGQWREKKCVNCDIVWNRDVVACLNLLKTKDVPVCVAGECLPMNLEVGKRLVIVYEKHKRKCYLSLMVSVNFV
jgi:putative transposase